MTTREELVIVRTASHRSREKMRRIAPEAVSLYLNTSWPFTSGFYEITAEQAPAVLAITGITKARDQKRESYGTAWTTGLAGEED